MFSLFSVGRKAACVLDTMKLNKNFIVHNTDEESLLVPVGNAEFSGIVRGNKTLGTILELLKKDTTEDELIAALKGCYDASADVIAADVKEALASLRKIGALDE